MCYQIYQLYTQKFIERMLDRLTPYSFSLEFRIYP